MGSQLAGSDSRLGHLEDRLLLAGSVLRLACVPSGWVSQRSVAFSKLMFNFVNEYSLGAFHQNDVSYPKVHTVHAILLKEKSSTRN